MDRKKSHKPKVVKKRTVKRNPASAQWSNRKTSDEKTYSSTVAGKPRLRADSSYDSLSKWKGRAREPEVHDENVHPLDQAYKGWTFNEWCGRPAGFCESEKDAKRYRPRLTEELAVTVARMLSEGLFQYHVEGLLGLSDKAITNWLQRAKKHEAKLQDWLRQAKRFESRAGAIESLGPRPEVTIHMKVAVIITKAESMGETSLYGALIAAALDGDSRVAMWLLERKYPERFGRLAMRTDLERDEKGKVKINPIAELGLALQAVADRAEE